MLNRHLTQLLACVFVITPAARGQAARAEPPRALAGAWELVIISGRPVPHVPQRDGTDPSECDGYGEYAGTRVGEGRLVIRPEEMWLAPRSGRWQGGVYAYVPEEIVCRASGGELVLLRRDQHNDARPAAEISPAWRGRGSYGSEDSTSTLQVGDYAWAIVRTGTAAGGELVMRDAEGEMWIFRRAAPGPQFETPGFHTLLGDFDGDGRSDQASVVPRRHNAGTMMVSLAAGSVSQVAEIPAGAHVALAPRGRTWRNADGTTLLLHDRDAVVVSVEIAPDRSDVTIYYVRNGSWVAWEYAPD